jgi:serine/threonine-protein kinase
MTELNLLGRTIGRFEILSELGRGGMAVVYRARQTDLERMVALKILPPEFSLDKSYSARFQQEARSVAALEHPHIVPIFEVGTAEGFQYIAMKYIAGRTLKDVVQEQGALSVQQAATILDQAAEALDYAHSEGVIHRDIKPSNIMVAQNGWIYLTDFGLARSDANSGLTMTGTVMGTPEYMSPEQAQGLATIGPPTDIYSLGIVLYEMLTGNMPFQADTPMGMLVARLQYAPRPPRDYRGDLTMAVEDVLMRALARKPEARYATAKDMIRALKNAADIRPQAYTSPTQPVSPPHGVQQPINRPPTPPTPPYVKPAAAPTIAVPRVATPPAMPVANADRIGLPASTTPTAGVSTAKPAGSKRGLLIGVAAFVLLLLLGGGFALFQMRADPRVSQGLTAGQTALDQKDGMDKAIAAYTQVLAADPQNATAHTQLALIYNLRSRFADAEKEARAALKTDPKNPLALAMLAESLNDQNDQAGALEAADKAVGADAKASVGYSTRSAIKADSAAQSSDKELFKQAVADADKALELAASETNLTKALAHSARGYVYWQQYLLDNDNSAVKRGVEEFNQAIGLQGQFAIFHSNLGYFYNAQGEYDQARETFEAALAADDQYGHAHAGLGWNLYYLKDYAGARGEFDKAIQLDTYDMDAYIGKSRTYEYQDKPDYDQAIETLTQATAVAANRPNVFTDLGWAYVNKAAGFDYASDDQKTNYDAAEGQFRKALELNDKYFEALTGLGWVLRDQAEVLKDDAKNEESITTVQQSLDIKEDQPYAHYTLGWSHYDLKQYDEAETAFRRSTELSSTYADAYYGLGRTLEMLNKKDEARTAYQTALDHGSPYAKEALDRLK